MHVFSNTDISEYDEPRNSGMFSSVPFFARRSFAVLVPARLREPQQHTSVGVRRFREQMPSVYAALRRGLEALRHDSGAFVAAASDDYNSCWIRDQIYATLAYYYTGEFDRFREGVRVVFDILERNRAKIEHAICTAPERGSDYIHAKYAADTFNEVTDDWGHHQIDAIGLFLFVVGNAEKHNVDVVESAEDRELLQLLVSYLTTVRYWELPDNGMWEEWMELHASSLGAAVSGLTLMQEMGLAVVPGELIGRGERALYSLLPNETAMRDTDMALLSLIWPYRVVDRHIAEEIIDRVREKLVRGYGVNRYWDDDYYRSDDGVSGEWPLGLFWLSLAAHTLGRVDEAADWFTRGLATMTEAGEIPEIYQNSAPNDHTPLAWAHSFALIAGVKLHA